MVATYYLQDRMDLKSNVLTLLFLINIQYRD